MPSWGRGYTRGLPAPERRSGVMPLPVLTDEQRKQALEKAAIARKKRAELKGQLKSGKLMLKDVLSRQDDDTVGKMKVSTVLESLPVWGRSGRARSWNVWTSPPADGSGVSARSSASRSSASSRRSSHRWPAGCSSSPDRPASGRGRSSASSANVSPRPTSRSRSPRAHRDPASVTASTIGSCPTRTSSG